MRGEILSKEILYREIMGNIIKTSRLNKRVTDGKIQQTGIHHSQHFLLMFLSKHSEMPSQREIAKELDISPAAVATTIKKLEQGGYIKKNIDQEDGRVHEIGLTDKGRYVVEKSKRLFQEKNSEIFEGIDEEELLQVQKTLGKVLQNLKDFEQRQRKGELK